MILYYLEYVCNIYNIGFVITIERLPWIAKTIANFFTQNWFCVNLGGNLLLHYLTNYLIINTLVN